MCVPKQVPALPRAMLPVRACAQHQLHVLVVSASSPPPMPPALPIPVPFHYIVSLQGRPQPSPPDWPTHSPTSPLCTYTLTR